jgi:hypothetical protein
MSPLTGAIFDMYSLTLITVIKIASLAFESALKFLSNDQQFSGCLALDKNTGSVLAPAGLPARTG